MRAEDTIKLSLPELFDLLAISTEELANYLIHRSFDSRIIDQKNTEVQIILSAIDRRKLEIAVVNIPAIDPL